MKNFKLSLSLVDGSLLDVYHGVISGKTVIHELITDDFSPPPIRMCMQVRTDSGKIISINIPYNDASDATVMIDGEPID